MDENKIEQILINQTVIMSALSLLINNRFTFSEHITDNIMFSIEQTGKVLGIDLTEAGNG